MIRTVQDYERAGIAGLHLEDQVMPKRCGHMAGKQVVPAGEMVAKVRAAVAARSDPDLLLIARTDARAPHGIDEALERARAYREAGADMLFVEALEGVEEIELVAAGAGRRAVAVQLGRGGPHAAAALRAAGRAGLCAGHLPDRRPAGRHPAVQRYLAAVRRAGSPLPVLDELPGFDSFLDVIGLAEIGDLERRFADGAEAPAPAPLNPRRG